MKIKLEIEMDENDVLEMLEAVGKFKELLEELSYRMGSEEDQENDRKSMD